MKDKYIIGHPDAFKNAKEAFAGVYFWYPSKKFTSDSEVVKLHTYLKKNL